ncbi:hypothetical protein DEO72_LG2g3658 [Vigna unguiculata]|uniref:Uncharacterized protein n=1 Tax=Vigna unguiculata TaxID=3917 RepID=A0A4D6L4G3_VIGUN|nr:hypothetical protein DEO72_LG2g3658 [Vigna unguiculata]
MAAAGETVARPVNLAQASHSRLGETNRDSPKPALDSWGADDMWYEFKCDAYEELIPGVACNSLGPLGETSRVALQWSGRNPTAPVSGCPWWCPICITRVRTNPVFFHCSAVPPVLQVHHSSGCAPRSHVEVRLAFFQVREVRVSVFVSFWLVLGLVADCETVARPVNLAQASHSRLGETNRDSPKPALDSWGADDMWYEFKCDAYEELIPGVACNSLGPLGETSRVALQWSGRNPTAPVSGCPWWCPICITSSGVSSSGGSSLGVSRGIHHKYGRGSRGQQGNGDSAA